MVKYKSIAVDEELHQKIKRRCLILGISMRKYINDLVDEEIILCSDNK